MRTAVLTITLGLMLLTASAASADDTAMLQVIHNAADPAAAVVDIYVNSGPDPFLDDFAFRAATPYVEVPAGVNLNIGVAPGGSTGPGDVIKDFDVVLDPDGVYVAIANGVLDPSGFDPNPDMIDIAFSLYPRGDMELDTRPWAVKLIGFHGATDAPGVDVIARRGHRVRRIIDDMYYGEFSDYARVRAAHWELDVTLAGDNSAVVATYDADLSSLGGGAAIVFASGFLNGAQGPAFGLFAALPDGTVLELPPVTQTAMLQVIHNAADPGAAVVDIYVNNGDTPFLDDFAFRAAAPFVEVPAGVNVNIGVAPPTSTGPGDIIKDFDVVFEPDKTYVAVANGVLDPGAFDPNPEGLDIAFTLFARDGIRTGTWGSFVSLIALHGATDAPGVDVRVQGPYHNLKLFGDLSYGDFSDYRTVPALDYRIDITLAGDPDALVASYQADLTPVPGGAAVVFASGFLNDAQGPAFGLYAALPDGTVLELPPIGPTAQLQVIHNAADPAAEVVDIYVNNGPVPFLDDFAFRTATPYVDVPAGVELTIGVAPGTSTGPGDVIREFAVTLEPYGRYVAIANGVLAPCDFDENPDGRPIEFALYPRGDMREYVHFGLVKAIVFHGATDAPMVDVVAHGSWWSWRVANDIGYGDFSDYGTFMPTTYEFDVTLADDNSAVVATYEADLGPASSQALTVFASGFLNDEQGAAFGLFAALPDGTVLELPTVGTPVREGPVAEDEIPATFALMQNAPNPFNPVTTIAFSLPERQDVRLTVFNAKGQMVKTVVDEPRDAGRHTVTMDARELPSGVYFYRLEAGPHVDMKKMTLLK